MERVTAHFQIKLGLVDLTHFDFETDRFAGMEGGAIRRRQQCQPGGLFDCRIGLQRDGGIVGGLAFVAGGVKGPKSTLARPEEQGV